MLEIPRRLFFREKTLQSTSKGSLDSSKLSNIVDDEVIPLASFDDIEWATNVLEPEQQRGPSENP